MQDLRYDTEDLIAALATPWGNSALAVVRAGGPGAVGRVASAFSAPEKLRSAAGHTAVYGFLLDPRTGARIDEVVVSVFRAPRSYTGQELVEISCHGSLPGIEAVLEALRALGFRDAAPGEFTMRAFLNGKVDLTRAEAVREIVESKTRRAHGLALHRLGGGVEQRIDELKARLVGRLAAIEIELDYPPDEIEDEHASRGVYESVQETSRSVAEGLRTLLETYAAGRLYQDGARVALVGPTNAGKSSLFNMLLREDRAIVSELHGTTRDYLESWITIEGIPISLFDTAGLRARVDVVEAEGIRRTMRVLDAADLLLYLADASQGVTDEDRAFVRENGKRAIAVWAKSDLSEATPPQGWLAVSSITGSGLDELESAIAARLDRGGAGGGDLLIDSARQRDLLAEAHRALVLVAEEAEAGVPLDALAADFQTGLRALGEITGEVGTEDLLERMFADFCVGK